MNILKITDELLLENRFLLSESEFRFWLVDEPGYDFVEVDNHAWTFEYKGKYYIKQREFHGGKAIIIDGSFRVFAAYLTSFRINENVYNYK